MTVFFFRQHNTLSVRNDYKPGNKLSDKQTQKVNIFPGVKDHVALANTFAVVNSLYQPLKQHKIVYSVYSMGVTAPKLLESRNKTMGQIAIHDFEIISHVMIHTIIISHQPSNVHQ